MLDFLFDGNSILIGNIASAITIVLFLYSVIRFGIKYIINYRNKKFNRPFDVTEEEAERLTKIYIKTKFDNNVHKDKKYSIDRFLKKYMLNGTTQYHVILGDAGMGKSTFLLNLYYRINGKVLNKGYKADYISLRRYDAIQRIKDIENKKNIILLLDAFDESIHSAKNAKEYLELIENCTESFAKIVIASRKHFFDKETDEPNLVFGVGKSIFLQETRYFKHYILPFSTFDVLRYLRHKFPLSLIKQYKALRIINKSADIMARPLLLSYIEDLLNDKEYYKFSYEVFEVLVDKWVVREVDFIKDKADNKVDFDFALHEHAFHFITNYISIKMYINSQFNGEFAIATDEVNELYDLLASETPGLNKSLTDVFNKRIRSLLQRKNDNELEFCQQSIFEFLIAKNFKDVKTYRFDNSLKQVPQFLIESFLLGNEANLDEVPANWYENVYKFSSMNSETTNTGKTEDGIILFYKNYEDNDMWMETDRIIDVMLDLLNEKPFICKKPLSIVKQRIRKVRVNLQHMDIMWYFEIRRKFKSLSAYYHFELEFVDYSKCWAYTTIQIYGQYDTLFIYK